MQTKKKPVVAKQVTKNPSTKKKKNSVKKNKNSAKKQKLSTRLILEKTATAKTPTKDDVALKPSPKPKASPKTDENLKKKERATPRKPEKTAQKFPSPVSEALNTLNKKPSVKAMTPKEGTIYGEDEKNEYKKTAKTQSTTTIEQTKKSKEEPVKVWKPMSESSAHRHRDSLLPGEVNEKSDDTIEDAPSVRKKDGPSYESDVSLEEEGGVEIHGFIQGVPVISPSGQADPLTVKKLSKEKDQETAK
ncbi:hypothetical protein CAEBREN_32243 [Caenorhabditis brenneri]|uniref:Uncharacterized protein n=1 Tax=Caenorhabditis brenneri TaxID=135651 RepID=G0PA06_CAEBE|nr:hypothetical protein CAEBREN_32243 [Caenorhabditis brenneri]